MGTLTMVHRDEEFRLAVSVFAEPEVLWRTVGALLEAGLLNEQIGLVAPAVALTRFAPMAHIPDGSHEQLAALYRKFQVWSGARDGPQIVTTSSALLNIVLQAQAMSALASERTHAAARPASDLLRLVQSGFAAVIVRSPDASGQLLATHTLLENAQHKVSTYELIVPADRSQLHGS